MLNMLKASVPPADVADVVGHRADHASAADRLPHQRGYEALMRGHASDGALIPPFDLFGRAIVSGRLAELDRMSHLTHLRNAAPILPSAQWLFININPSTFTDADYARRLAQLTREAGLTQERLVIEVLESGGTDVADLARATRAFRTQRAFSLRWMTSAQGTSTSTGC